jgi:hypothetical protein
VIRTIIVAVTVAMAAMPVLLGLVVRAAPVVLVLRALAVAG